MTELIEKWLFRFCVKIADQYAECKKDFEYWEVEKWPEVEIWYEEFQEWYKPYKCELFKKYLPEISFEDFAKVYEANEEELQQQYIDWYLDR